MTVRRTTKISAAAIAELMRLPDKVDLAVADARIELVDEGTEEIMELIAEKLSDNALRRVKSLRAKIWKILDEVVFRTISVERSGPNRKKQRARSRGRRGGAVRSRQSRKKLVLELASRIDAETPGLSLNQLAKHIVDRLPGVELTTVRKYLVHFRDGSY